MNMKWGQILNGSPRYTEVRLLKPFPNSCGKFKEKTTRWSFEQDATWNWTGRVREGLPGDLSWNFLEPAWCGRSLVIWCAGRPVAKPLMLSYAIPSWSQVIFWSTWAWQILNDQPKCLCFLEIGRHRGQSVFPLSRAAENQLKFGAAVHIRYRQGIDAFPRPATSKAMGEISEFDGLVRWTNHT